MPNRHCTASRITFDPANTKGIEKLVVGFFAIILALIMI